ncbi:Retrovirus-related Pol polyprotein, partial [Mucuna pruriens]
MSFGLCNVPSTFQRCIISIFSDLSEFLEVFMDDFMVYVDSFDAFLENLSRVLTRCIEMNLVLNFEKCHFMVTEGIVLGHLVSSRGIEGDKAKVDIIISLPNPAFVWDVRSFLGHSGFYKRFIKKLQQDCPASIQAATKRGGFCLRQSFTWSHPRPTSRSQQVVTCDSLRLLNHGSNPNALYNYGGVVGNCICLKQISFIYVRSSTDSLYALDPEIEITLCRLRKARNIVVSGSSNSVSSSDNSSPVTNTFNFFEYNSTKNFVELEQMENNDRTLKELATPDVVYQPWCIQYPQLEPSQTYELKSGLIHLLPKFHGLARKDPHKHLKEFHVGIPEDYIKMKAFPFSLDGAAKD